MAVPVQVQTKHGGSGTTSSNYPISPNRNTANYSSFDNVVNKQVTNKNVNWLESPGTWFFIVGIIVLSWLILSFFIPPDLNRKHVGLAWTYVHLAHGTITYFLFHWFKGSPISEDQGKYEYQTFWEQLDDGVQYTPNRKFLTLVPVVLFFLATHGSDFRSQPLLLNLGMLLILIIAKTPLMHKVRIFGINKY